MNKNKEWRKRIKKVVDGANIWGNDSIDLIKKLNSVFEFEITQAEDNMRKRCLESVKGWLTNNPLDNILRKYKVSDEDIIALRDTLLNAIQATQNINNLDKGK